MCFLLYFIYDSLSGLFNYFKLTGVNFIILIKMLKENVKRNVTNLNILRRLRKNTESTDS